MAPDTLAFPSDLLEYAVFLIIELKVFNSLVF